jgi:hypothetical protein
MWTRSLDSFTDRDRFDARYEHNADLMYGFRLDQVTWQTAAFLLAEHWPEPGHRHDAVRALACTWLHHAPPDAGDVYVAEEFVREVAERAGDPGAAAYVHIVRDLADQPAREDAASALARLRTLMPPWVVARFVAWMRVSEPVGAGGKRWQE